MTGCLSYEEFVREAEDLVAASERLGDGWKLRRVNISDVGEETTTFLVRKKNAFVERHENASIEKKCEAEPAADVGEREDIEDEDPARLGATRNSLETVTFEYHVIHSSSYSVPVLYFTVSYENGRIVPLREVWKRLVSPFHVARNSGMEWESITQQEHPILGRPFYQLHPCHTSSVMATALGHSTTDKAIETDSKSRNLKYLISWLSIFGPTVGLDISLGYIT